MLQQVKINIYLVSVLTPTFKKDKYINDFNLRAFICGQKIDAIYKK